MDASLISTAVVQRLDDLATPALVLDRAIMERNIARFEALSRRLGVPLRPHGKTPKSAPIFRRLVRNGAVGLTTSTLAETEAAIDAGVADVFYAVPLDYRKVRQAAGLLRGRTALSFLTDTLDGARLCAEAATREDVVLPFWVEIDVDHYRTGISADSEDFRALARFLASHPNTRLRGLMSYGGASYGASAPDAAAALAEAHRAALTAAAGRLGADGIDALEISFGSGPAILHARDMTGVTELRAGIHVFQDLFQAGIGACRIEDIAVSVLASVIGARRDLNRLVIDAGGLALSKDRSTAGHSFDAGFGLVCDARSGKPIDDLYVVAVSQELGLMTTRSGSPAPFDRLPIGSQVRILPNHADMTAAAYQGYTVVDGDDRIIDYWARANHW